MNEDVNKTEAFESSKIKSTSSDVRCVAIVTTLRPHLKAPQTIGM